MTQDQIDQAEWENPSNWSGWLGLYRSERDSRYWVPKPPGRLSRGMTPNMAKRGSKTFFWGMAIIPAAALLVIVLLAIFRP